jgi:hypothetical protein
VIETFVAATRRRSTGLRVPIDVLWQAFAEAAPVDAAAIDARRRLADALEAGHRDGHWKVSKRQDGPGNPPLPAFVTLPRPDRPDRPDPSQTGWVADLAWVASQRRLGERQLTMLHQINAFLRDGGSDRPLVPAEERSLELFDNEKVITDRVGGQALWGPDRLSLDLLRCVPSKTPFAYEQVGEGTRLLVVENQATFMTCRDLLRDEPGHPYAAVVFGAGRAAGTTISYLTELPFPVTAVDYFGDLDIDGLEMAAACIHAAKDCGVDAGLHGRLYRLLSRQRHTPSKAAATHDRVTRVLPLLEPDLQGDIAQLLTKGFRIAQERCGRELLATTTGWWRW